MADPNVNQIIGDRIKSDIQVNSTPEGTRSNLNLPKAYQPPTMNDAIAAKAYKQFYNPQELEGMQDLKGIKNSMNQSQQLESVATNAANLTKQQMDLAKQRVADAEKQRAQLIGTVLGLGGAVAGAAIGGPAGAGVGYSAGSAVGQSQAGGAADGLGTTRNA